MEVRFGDHLRRRHEGYLRSDLLAATLRSNRKVDVFVLRTTHQKFFRFPHPPDECFDYINVVHTSRLAAGLEHLRVRGLRVWLDQGQINLQAARKNSST
jgi:hypothetical protein